MKKSRRWILLFAALGSCVVLAAIAVFQSATAQEAGPFQVQVPQYFEPPRAGVVVSSATTDSGPQSFRVTRVLQETIRRDLPHTEEINRLVGQLSGNSPYAATDDAQTQWMDELKKRLGDQFDFMHEEQQKQMDELAARLERLKKTHQARSDAREEIISRRLNELLRKPDPLAWDPAARPTPVGVQVATPMPARPRISSTGSFQRTTPNPPPRFLPEDKPVGGEDATWNPAPTRRERQVVRSEPYQVNLQFRNKPIPEARVDGATQNLLQALGLALVDDSDDAQEQMESAIGQARNAVDAARKAIAELDNADGAESKIESIKAAVSKLEAAIKKADQATATDDDPLVAR